MTQEFELLDDPRVPPTIKPMIKLHDILVRGWRQDKEIRLPKLITKMENGIKEQVSEMVKLEENEQFISITLVQLLNDIRKLCDGPTDVEIILGKLRDTLDETCTKLEKKYK